MTKQEHLKESIKMLKGLNISSSEIDDKIRELKAMQKDLAEEENIWEEVIEFIGTGFISKTKVKSVIKLYSIERK